jgi:hypothetical protein
MNHTKYSTVLIELPEPYNQRILDFTDALIDKDVIVEPCKVPHITVKWGIQTSDVEEVAKAIGTFIPIRIMFGTVRLFMADRFRDTDVVKIDVFSMTAKKLHYKIKDNLDTMCTYSNYSPHVTLAAIKPKTGMVYVGGSPVVGEKIVVDKLMFRPSNGEPSYIHTDGTITNV